MTNSTVAVGEFLANTPPFDQLSLQSKEQLIANSQLLRYRLGQTLAFSIVDKRVYSLTLQEISPPKLSNCSLVVTLLVLVAYYGMFLVRRF